MQDFMSMFQDQLAATLPVLPEVRSDGDVVEICANAPEEIVKEAMREPPSEGIKMIIDAIGALKEVGLTVDLGTRVEDLLASPDTPLPELLGGVKVGFNISASSIGKKTFIESLGLLGPESAPAAALARLFAGLEYKVVTGFHKDKIGKAIEQLGLPPEITGLMNLTGMRGFCDGNIPPEAIEEMGPVMKQVLDIVDAFTCIDSVLMEGCVFGYEGRRWDDDRKELEAAENVEVKVEFQNLNLFALVKYMAANVREKLASPTA